MDDRKRTTMQGPIATWVSSAVSAMKQSVEAEWEKHNDLVEALKRSQQDLDDLVAVLCYLEQEELLWATRAGRDEEENPK